MKTKDLILLGNSLSNELRGSAGSDFLVGNDGDDILSGGGGDDLLMGGLGVDFLQGGNGDDKLLGGQGNDYLFGGSGRDYLCGDAGVDRLYGGYGADTFAFNVDPAVVATGIDIVSDFTIGEDKIAIVNGWMDKVTVVDEGWSLGVYYDGVKIAALLGIGSVPADASAMFVAAPLS